MTRLEAEERAAKLWGRGRLKGLRLERGHPVGSWYITRPGLVPSVHRLDEHGHPTCHQTCMDKEARL